MYYPNRAHILLGIFFGKITLGVIFNDSARIIPVTKTTLLINKAVYIFTDYKLHTANHTLLLCIRPSRCKQHQIKIVFKISTILGNIFFNTNLRHS